jgi:chorismate mutase / prephenate dehydrogenase
MVEPTYGVGAQRAAIDEVDGALLTLVAQRRCLVSELFRHKRSMGLPLIDPVREAELLTQWRATAQRVDVPQSLAEDLLRVLLEDSHALV